jgi:hypothetical protein
MALTTRYKWTNFDPIYAVTVKILRTLTEELPVWIETQIDRVVSALGGTSSENIQWITYGNTFNGDSRILLNADSTRRSVIFQNTSTAPETFAGFYIGPGAVISLGAEELGILQGDLYVGVQTPGQTFKVYFSRAV